MPPDWKFYVLPLHTIDFEKLEALANARKLQPLSVGAKKIPPPIQIAHQIISEYMAAHAEEVSSAAFNAAAEKLGPQRGGVKQQLNKARRLNVKQSAASTMGASAK